MVVCVRMVPIDIWTSGFQLEEQCERLRGSERLSLSLPPAHESDDNSQRPLGHHACPLTALLSAVTVVDSPSETISEPPTKRFLLEVTLIMVSLYSSRTTTKTNTKGDGDINDLILDFSRGYRIFVLRVVDVCCWFLWSSLQYLKFILSLFFMKSCR